MQKPNSPRTRLRRNDPVTELWLLVSALFAITLVAMAIFSAAFFG